MNNVLADEQTAGSKASAGGLAPALTSRLAGSKEANASSSSVSSGTSTPENTPDVDFVLVFESIPKKYLRPGKVPTTEKNEIAREYQRLVDAVSSVGLQVTSREGKVGSGQVLLFIRAHDGALVKIGREENLIDYLHGVRTPFEPSSASIARTSSLPKGSTHALAESQFSPSDRLRHIYTLLTLPAAPVTSEGITRRGAGLRIRSEDYPHLVDITPLHDPSYNRAWLKRWSSWSSFLAINFHDLDEIRRHFGHHVAFYFGFLLYYFQSLASVAAIGGGFWILGMPYHPIYSIALVLWACIFVESWRIRERKLAVRWGTLGCGDVQSRRLGFKPIRVDVDQVTGEKAEIFEWWRRELRVAGNIPAVLFFAALLGLTLTTMFVTEVFVTRLYDGPGSQFVPFIPTALFSVCIPSIMAAWQATAHGLTSWENHFSQRDFNWSMTVKMFALQAFVAYGALTLSAFIYIPFGQELMDHIVSQGYFAGSIANAIAAGRLQKRSDGGIQFEINPDRMHRQLFAVLTTSQVINAFTEIALPFILRKVNDLRSGSGDSKATKSKKASDETNSSDPSEKKFLQRVYAELALPEYDTFGDYAEMATQFGYITLWSVIWPLAPLGGLINNFFEMRGDALKICSHTRRPVPMRTDSIGPWLEILGFIAWLAAMTNASLVYLFQRSPEAHLPGHSAYEATMRTHLHPGSLDSIQSNNASSLFYSNDPSNSAQSPLSFSRLLPSFLPKSGASGAMIAALLVALASEHGYGLIRTAVHHVLERAIWRNSQEEITLKRREWEMKREAVGKSNIQENDGQLSEKVARRDVGQDVGGFWDSQRDVGLNAIQTAGKTE
ncbi:unnamed protein product [Sympodiomycopsis kandeliae]